VRRAGQRPDALLRVVSFLAMLLDGAGRLPFGPYQHRHDRALLSRSSSTSRSASNGKLIPNRPPSQWSARVRCVATHPVSSCALIDDGASPSLSRHWASAPWSPLTTRMPLCGVMQSGGVPVLRIMLQVQMVTPYLVHVLSQSPGTVPMRQRGDRYVWSIFYANLQHIGLKLIYFCRFVFAS
jgi:hypothetical protein